VEKNKGKPTVTFSQVQAAGAKVGKIPRPIPAPTSIPDPGEINLDFEQQQPEQMSDLNSGSRNHGDKSYEKFSGPNGDFAVPTMEELGFPASTTPHRGGETVTLEMLDKLISNERYIATFEKPNTAPTAFDPQGTTLPSTHLHFGSLSIRELYWRVQDVVENYSGKPSQPPVSLTGQLLFRDMYFGAQAALSCSFGQTMYNSHCRFIPWDLPSKVDHDSKLVIGSYHIDSPQAEEWFQRWKYGCTGFPLD
jgi:cryptochrome